MRIASLADDLTGALEIGANFARHSLASVVLATAPGKGCLEIPVIDTETRHLPPSEAAAVVARLTARLLAAGTELLYKKTDSTLRGNIGPELDALASAAHARVLYAPAYPALGRTVRAGRLYVDGVPLEQTAFARDPLNPITSSEIARIVSAAVTVFDGETEEDIGKVAGEILRQAPPRLAAGPAALAHALAGHLGGPPASIQWPVLGTALLVNGSLHPVSGEQMRRANEAGFAGWRTFNGLLQGDGIERAESAGRQIASEIDGSGLDALIVFGGDTAWGAWKAMGFPPIRPLGEILPGVPVSRIQRRTGPLWLVTKAGGFGPPDLLCRLHELVG